MSRAPFSDLLVQESYAFALTHGLLMSTGKDFEMTHCPFTLYPTEIPRECFSTANTIAPSFNKLVDAVARDIPFLKDVLAGVCVADEFMRRLMTITLDVYGGSHRTQKWMLGIHRSDYMIEAETHRLLQVEINTISVAFTALSTQVNLMHAYTTSKTNPKAADMVKISNANQQVPMAMRDAVHVWRKERHPLVQNCTVGVVMFVVQPAERNVADQRTLEQTLWTTHGVRSVRVTLEAAATTLTLSPDLDLTMPDGTVIALAYFRCGYTPGDYYSEQCWAGRELIERGNCVKCPSLPYHLCTAKKVQEKLSNDTVLSSYVKGSEMQVLKDCMMPQYDLTSSAAGVTAAIERAIRDPDSHVLKPQREGGGTLVHSSVMVDMLKRGLTPDEKAEYILMEKIKSVEMENIIIRNGAVFAKGLTVPELGIFGVFLGNGTDAPAINAAVGHLLRTKMAESQDGGVVSGVSALDSPFVKP